jgi:hypothetical protein
VLTIEFNDKGVTSSEKKGGADDHGYEYDGDGDDGNNYYDDSDYDDDDSNSNRDPEYDAYICNSKAEEADAYKPKLPKYVSVTSEHKHILELKDSVYYGSYGCDICKASGKDLVYH